MGAEAELGGHLAPVAVGAQLPGEDVVGQADVQDLLQANLQRTVQDRRDGHRIATKLTHSFKLTIKRKGLKKGKHKLVAKATDSAKRTGSKTKKFKVCR